MPIIRYNEVEISKGAVENTRRRIFINPDMGAGAITVGELTMEPGVELPMHTHRIEEAMVITKGTATSVLGDKTDTLEPGDVILAPAGIKHMLANRANEPMTFLFFYPAVEVRLERV